MLTFGTEIVYPLLDILTLFLITQTKAQNIPLYLIFTIQNAILSASSSLSPSEISLTTLFLAQTAYFASANNNAISSVDLSNAYNGVSGYNAVVVGLLVFVSNWAGPIWWSIRGIVNLSPPSRTQPPTAKTKETEPSKKDMVETEQEEERFSTHITLLTLWLSVSTTAVMVACTVLRTHLFVWSVFSPKFLMQAAWAACWHVCVNIILGSGMWGLCFKLFDAMR